MPLKAPSKVLRLIEELRSRGSDAVQVQPRPICSRQRRLTHRQADGWRICRSCYDKSPARNCSRCGKLKQVSARTDDGQPLCTSCYR